MYKVIIDSLWTVYEGKDSIDAVRKYVAEVKTGGHRVTLLVNNAVVEEYVPSRDGAYQGK